eukprot:CAMPEP_0171332148 /NCGR_PEP_ID=MMETSP0878-20121228/3182_1 /TAXON_ID=67004 /ORGANISM="Thalassiosira weissflogii, Strain CCMP1336" /LENGTH=658 /DNA_ID=CAMNT_0011832847 /DNA_START=81 /DNA_END=2057 /DNA_ORIENTATION=-
MYITPQAAASALLLLSSLSIGNAVTSADANANVNVQPKETKSSYTPRHRAEFLAAMTSSSTSSSNSKRRRRHLQSKSPSSPLDMKTFQEALLGTSPRSQRLRRKVMERAVPTNEEGRRMKEIQERKEEQAKAKSHERLLSNDDDHADDDKYAYDDDDGISSASQWKSAYGFDITQFSLSYYGCADAKQYDDEMAATEDAVGVLKMEHYAIFRLCPSMTCDPTLMDEVVNQGWNGNDNNNNANANANANANNAQGQQEQIDYENIGARGSGCQKSYGEYMLTITEFLEIMAEYHAERFEMYCEYCEECMYDVYQSWMEDMMQNMSEEYAEEMMEQYEQQQQQQRNYNNWNYRKLVEQGVIPRENVEQWTRTLSQYEIAGKYQQLCDEFDSCKVYNSLCKNGIDDDIEEYFECTQANDVYVGPHCSVEDSYTIELGVYYDQYCSDYIGPFVDSVLGQDYAQDPLQDYYHPQEQVCIPCKGFDRDYLTLEEQREEMMNLEYDPDAGINELCEDLYASAMRCDEHFRYYGSQFKSEYYSPQEMELSCQFIESVMNDNFNEFGEVNIQEAGWNTYLKSKSLMWNEYGHNVTDVKPWQIILLILSIGSCVALAMWSVKLHDSLRKGWKPRNADSTAAALGGGSELSREASGIHMARSNGSYYMT